MTPEDLGWLPKLATFQTRTALVQIMAALELLSGAERMRVMWAAYILCGFPADEKKRKATP